MEVSLIMIHACTVLLIWSGHAPFNEHTNLKPLLEYLEPKGLITLCVVSLVFLFHLAFFILPRVFPRVHVGIQNARENARKTREKSKTRAQRQTMFLYYTMRWVKTRISCVLVVFWMRFGHKHCQNANPTHSVIWP